MDLQQQHRTRLKPIQEQSEQKDETEGSKTREGSEEEEEEDFQIEVSPQIEEAMAKDESEEDDDEDEEEEDVPLKVLRPQLSFCSFSRERNLQMQSTNNHLAETENCCVSGGRTLGEKKSGPKLKREKRSSSGELRIQVFRDRWEKVLEQPLQKRTSNKRRKKMSAAGEPFPLWVEDLMVNIEEAKTHPLVIE